MSLTKDSKDQPTGKVVDEFENSAHPPIALLVDELTPESFAAIYKADADEVLVYTIIYEDVHHAAGDALVTTVRLAVDLVRDGTALASLVFDGKSREAGSWLDLAPDHADLHTAPTKAAVNDVETLALAMIQNDRVRLDFAIEDTVSVTSEGMDLVQLLHLMEGAGVGRPSTYAGILNAITKNGLLSFDEKTQKVAFTDPGKKAAKQLASDGGTLGTVEFASEFDTRLTLLAQGSIDVPDFLTWVLEHTGFDDELHDNLWAELSETSGIHDPESTRLTKGQGVVNTAHTAPPPSRG